MTLAGALVSSVLVAIGFVRLWTWAKALISG